MTRSKKRNLLTKIIGTALCLVIMESVLAENSSAQVELQQLLQKWEQTKDPNVAFMLGVLYATDEINDREKAFYYMKISAFSKFDDSKQVGIAVKQENVSNDTNIVRKGNDFQFITVKKGETVGMIAERLQYLGGTYKQRVNALYNLNRASFGNGQLNSLLVGSQLIIPTDVDINKQANELETMSLPLSEEMVQVKKESGKLEELNDLLVVENKKKLLKLDSKNKELDLLESRHQSLVNELAKEKNNIKSLNVALAKHREEEQEILTKTQVADEEIKQYSHNIERISDEVSKLLTKKQSLNVDRDRLLDAITSKKQDYALQEKKLAAKEMQQQALSEKLKLVNQQVDNLASQLDDLRLANDKYIQVMSITQSAIEKNELQIGERTKLLTKGSLQYKQLAETAENLKVDLNKLR